MSGIISKNGIGLVGRYFFCLLMFAFSQLTYADAEKAKQEIQDLCKDPVTGEVLGPFDCRVRHEHSIRNAPFVLIPHKPSYILASWDNTLDEQDEKNETYETKFQFSFKLPLLPFNDEWIAFFGYTQLSVWQMANKSNSSPFRDTNYEPEVMLYYIPKGGLFNGTLRLINFGLFNHQSNGQSGDQSRSWNRSYIQAVFELNRHNYIALTAWHRHPERKKTGPNDAGGDDNEDIEKFVGREEIRYHYVGDIFNFSVSAKNNLNQDENSYGSYQVDFTFPLNLFKKKGLRAYIQYFNGYGETLIDYNQKRDRFGVGVILADWL